MPPRRSSAGRKATTPSSRARRATPAGGKKLPAAPKMSRGARTTPTFSKSPRPTSGIIQPNFVEFHSSRVREAAYTGTRGRDDFPPRRVQVTFQDGTPWHYDDVEPQVWQRFKRSASAGKFVNRVLNNYPYGRGH